MDWRSARWIWLDGDDGIGVRHVLFQRDFRLEEPPEQAVLAVTASTSFRLRINGQWSADGPGRSWPEHYSCEMMECSHLLRRGLNRLEAEVFYAGSGPRGGFLASLQMTDPSGSGDAVVTDETWLAALVRRADAPETAEFFDASSPAPVFAAAAVICGAEEGPWRDIGPRTTPPLSRREALIRRVTESYLVERQQGNTVAPIRRIGPLPPGTVSGVQSLIYPDDRCAVIRPAEGGDIELCCDLGAPDAGYWNVVLRAPGGTVVDMTCDEEPAVRCVCRGGWNRFTSRIRRCGRVLRLVLRRMTGEVRIQSVRLVESTYPVVSCGEFRCSDGVLTALYDDGLRALKLGMADTFTDFSFGGEHFRVADLRNKILAALSVCGAPDLAEHSLRFAGECLTRPPEGTDTFPPGPEGASFAAAFLWVLTFRDLLRECGDSDFLRAEYPRILRVLEAAVRKIDGGSGLLREPSRPVLLRDTLLFKGALDAACELAEPAGAPPETAGRLRAAAEGLSAAANRLWDERRLAYRDGLDPEGRPLEKYGVTTGMLALLFDVVPEKWRVSAGVNTVSPREGIDGTIEPCLCGAWFDTLESLEMFEPLMEKLRRGGASGCPPELPLFALPRTVLGLRAREGGRKFDVSPFVRSLDWASGVRWTPCGPVRLRWCREGARNIEIAVSVPPGVEASCVENASMRDFDVRFRTIQSAEM